MKIQQFLANYDFDLQLSDALADPDLPETRRLLAAIGRDEGLDGGYYEAQELAEVFLEAAHEANAGVTDDDSPARVRMREILGRRLDYQREMFEVVALLPLADAAADLCWLTALMKDRADMHGPVSRARS
ncbi:hypothetical protein [Sphingomonas sp. YL-JM2C]